MQTRILLIAASLFLLAGSAWSQGTFVYDQQSSTDETPFPGSGAAFQQFASYGQSFKPALASIDFIRLKLSDNNPGNGLGATLFVNLRSSPTNGVLLGSTQPVFLADAFTGPVSFILPSTVTLTPGLVYFFEPIVQSGDQWLIDAAEYGYPGGNVFVNGIDAGMSDVWFREGIIVPEPSSLTLALSGLACFAVLIRRRRNR